MVQNTEYSCLEDSQLIAQTINGDSRAFGQLVERYWAMGVGLAISKVPDIMAAEDIAQDSFIKAYSNLRKLRNPERFAGWLCKIVNQNCLDYLRQKMRKPTIKFSSAAFEKCEPIVSCTNPGLTEEQKTFVREKMSTLPGKLRDVIIMRFIGRLSAVQIAEQLGKKPSAIRVRLHRAYQKLKIELAPILEEVNEL